MQFDLKIKEKQIKQKKRKQVFKLPLNLYIVTKKVLFLNKFNNKVIFFLNKNYKKLKPPNDKPYAKFTYLI